MFSPETGRYDHTASSIDVNPGGWKGFSRPARFVIILHTFLTGFLSFWIYQEYMNNMYLRIYVNNVLQTMGWAFTILIMIVVLGSVMIAVSRKKSAGNRIEAGKIETSSIQVEIPTETTTKAGTKSEIDLHPIVAQLKAEMARRPVPVESVPVPKMEERPAPTGKQAPFAEEPTALATPPTVIVGLVPVQKKEPPAEKKAAG